MEIHFEESISKKTLEDHADVSSDLKSKLATFITDFGSEDSADGASLTHYNALQASRIYQDVLLSDKTYQVAVPGRWGGTVVFLSFVYPRQTILLSRP